MLASSISQGAGVGWPGGFVQGHHMAYSSALEVKSFAFCYCSRIVHSVILFPARPSLLLWQVCGKYLCFHWQDLSVWRCQRVAAAHRVVMDTLCVRLVLIRGLTLLSRHHSPSLSIVDEFNFNYINYVWPLTVSNFKITESTECCWSHCPWP